MSSTLEDYCRRRAADAEREAGNAISPEDRERWLRVAAHWVNLLKQLPATEVVLASEDEQCGCEAGPAGGHGRPS